VSGIFIVSITNGKDLVELTFGLTFDLTFFALIFTKAMPHIGHLPGASL
jgi:hypothetical protein